MTIPTLVQIVQEVEAITDEQLQAMPFIDLQEGEEVIGNISDQIYIHRIWALAHDYGRRSSFAAHSAQYGSVKNRNELLNEAHWLEVQETFIRDLAWIEIRRLFPQTIECESIGIRTGYAVVKSKSKQQEIMETVDAIQEALNKRLGIKRPPPDEGKIQ